MADVLTPEQRRRCMSRNKGSNTTPEVRLRRALWSAGLRYRVHPRLPGKPDLAFNRARIAVFVDGCFWHRCPLHATHPRTNEAFWAAKLDRNVQRDREVEAQLERAGWTVCRFWEHELEADLADAVDRIRRALGQQRESPASDARPSGETPMAGC